MLLKVTSNYVGKCFRGKKNGAYVVHQIWMRPKNKSKVAVIQDVHTKLLKAVSLRTVYRAYKDGRMMVGYTWFFCGYCRGSGTNERGNEDCPRCKGTAVLWLDVGYTLDDIEHDELRKPRREKLDIEDIVPG